MKRLMMMIPLAALLAGCGGTTTPLQISALQPQLVIRTAPSGFVVRPDIARPACNGGRGARLTGRGTGEGVVATGIMADGSTLTAFTQIYPGTNHSVLYAVTSHCRPDSTVGTAGVAEIRIPPRLVPLRTTAQRDADYLWILAVAKRANGGAIVAGTYRNRWVVGAVGPKGRLDPQFGSGGWTVLPLRGDVTAVVQEQSGRIVIAGDNNGGGCCTVNHAAALSAGGHWDRNFGNDGRVKLPTGEDSGVNSLAIEPNGDVLAEVDYGNMGCWGLTPAMLTRTGQPVAHFAGRIASFWRRSGFHAFVGDTYVDHGGFTLVGTGQKPCADGPRYSAKSATGVLARFQTNGLAAAPTVRFPSKLYGGFDGFKDGIDTLILESPYIDTTRQTLLLLRPDGSTDTGFGTDGRVRIRTPWRGHDAAVATSLLVIKAGPKSLVLVVTADGHRQLQVTRVHF